MNPTEKAILVILLQNGMLMTVGSQVSIEKTPKKVGRFWEGKGKSQCHLDDVATAGRFFIRSG